MLDLVSDKIRNLLYRLEARIERSKHGYVKKLPKNQHYFAGGMYDIIKETAEKYPHHIAIDYFKTHITYRSLIKRINRTAAALKASGVEKGDRVTICMPNTPEAVYMFYAVNEIGAVANMIHPLSSEKEIEEYVNRAHSKFILTIAETYPKVEAVIKNTQIEQVVVASAGRSMRLLVRFVYWLTKGRKNHISESQQVLTWDTFLIRADRYHADPHAEVHASDPAVILYTGGTTGKPKGAVLTNLNFNSQVVGAHYLVPELLKSNYSMLTFLPNFHAFGLSVCMHLPLYSGMRMVLVPQFNPKKIHHYIKNYKINVFVAVPTVYDYMLKMKFKPDELKNIKGAGSGGDMVSPELKKNLNNFLAAHGSKGCMYNGYGLTEAGGCAAFPPTQIAREPDVVGFPMADTEILIIDPKTNLIVPTGQDGEIVLNGPTIMQGYLDNPTETEKVFIQIGRKKYLRTGDLGCLDERGALHFKGRIKRIIITNGYNVYPSHVEDITRKCPLVEKAACLGIPDELRGEIVKICIVLKDAASERAARKELSKIYKQYLAKYEIPRQIVFMGDLPKTKLGKVDYKSLLHDS